MAKFRTFVGSSAQTGAMSTDAFDMAIVHRIFRNELHNAPGLVRGVKAGDTKRSAIVGRHLNFIMSGLHHHHAAEDELIWPKLHARAPNHAAEITRMEDEHRGIAEGVASVQDIVASWVASAEPGLAKQLISAIEDLSTVVDDHLADEEVTIVPLINEHITPVEWPRGGRASSGVLIEEEFEARAGPRRLRLRRFVSRRGATVNEKRAVA